MKRLVLIILMMAQFGFSQVGINTTNPQAQLDIKSSNQVTPSNKDGILIPKIDAFPLTNPTALQQGMMVYLTTLSAGKQPGFYYWDNVTVSWLSIGGNPTSAGWSLTGNSGTNSATNFIGTTNDVDVVFKRNNVVSGQLRNLTTSFGQNALAVTTGNNNVAFGGAALQANTSGVNNAAFGLSALSANTVGGSNFAIGYNTLGSNTTASSNVAIGANSLSNQNFSNGGVQYNTDNIAIGVGTLTQNNPTATTNGIKNVAIGNFSLANNTIGSDNIALGYEALGSNNVSNKNIAIGNRALSTQSYSNSGTTFDSNNVAIGYEALFNNNPTGSFNGKDNISIGKESSRSNTIGISNISIGTESLRYNTVASNNIAIGKSALYMQNFSNSNAIYNTNNIAIGTNSLNSNSPTNNTNGVNNVGVGYSTLMQNSVGNDNTALGTVALVSNSTGINNTGVGSNAGFYTSVGSNNTIVGKDAYYTNIKGSCATAIGSGAMRNANTTTTPYENRNIAVGFEALRGSPTTFNNVGNDNTALGYQSMINNSIGNGNIAVGSGSLFTNSAGSFNTANGVQALYKNTSGNSNIAVGYQALYNSNAIQNVATGVQALYSNDSGNWNTATGFNSLYKNIDGNSNAGVGNMTLYNNITGSGNVAIGSMAGYNELGSNKLYIENSNSTTPLIYGEFDTDLARVNGNFRVNSSTVAGAELQVKNSNLFIHNDDANLNFGTGFGYFMLSTQDNSGGNETGGIRGDGDNVSIWSPGDGGRQLRILDEDSWSDNNGNPYDNGAEVAYIASNGQYFQVSDKNKKENIVKIEKASDKISQISGYTYQYKLNKQEIEKGQKSVSASGVLAQEIEQVLPEAIQKNESGEYFVDYAAITPLLIEALKEQNAKIKAFEERLKKLEEK